MTSWPGFEVLREDRDGASVLSVRGELDIGQAARLGEEMAQAAGDRPDLTVDLREVTFCDSSGLAALLQGRRLFPDLRYVPGDAVLHVAKLGCVDETLFGPAGDAGTGEAAES